MGAWSKFGDTETGCRYTWETAFTKGLLPEYFSKERFLMFPRGTQQLKQDLEQPGLFQVVIGPSDSGKTWTYFLALENRKDPKNFIYLYFRGAGPGHTAQDFIKLISHQLGHTSQQPDIE